jgi:hypothetical protein
VRSEKLVNEVGSSSRTQRKWTGRREKLVAEARDRPERFREPRERRTSAVESLSQATASKD